MHRTNNRRRKPPKRQFPTTLVVVAILLNPPTLRGDGAIVKVVCEALDAARKIASGFEGSRLSVVCDVPVGIREIAPSETGVMEGVMKSTYVQSLRYQVEKWLTPTTPVHVTAFGRTGSGGGRYVCVETVQPAGARALFFFRHGDGCWQVFPPAADRSAHKHHKGPTNH
jgi:hypothetical protein